MKGINLFNKDRGYMWSRKNPELLYEDAKQQHDYMKIIRVKLLW